MYWQVRASFANSGGIMTFGLEADNRIGAELLAFDRMPPGVCVLDVTAIDATKLRVAKVDNGDSDPVGLA
jgi:hypothetical protein